MMNQLSYRGFEPSEEIKLKADEVLNQLVDRAPFGAFVNAMIEKEGEHFRCTVNLFSQQGPFYASIVDSDISKTLERVKTTLIKKLISWRKSKYEHEPLIA